MLGKYALQSKVFCFVFCPVAGELPDYKIKLGKIVKKEQVGDDVFYYVKFYDDFMKVFLGPVVAFPERLIAKTEKELLPLAIDCEEKDLEHAKKVNALLEANGKPTYAIDYRERKIENLKAELSA